MVSFRNYNGDMKDLDANQFLGGKVWKSDPSHWLVKSLWVGLTLVGLWMVWYTEFVWVRTICNVSPWLPLYTVEEDDISSCLQKQTGKFQAYDRKALLREDTGNDGTIENGMWIYLKLIERTMGLTPDETIRIITFVSTTYFALLMTLSLVSPGVMAYTSTMMDEKRDQNLIKNSWWKRVGLSEWKNENCYNEMFREPRREWPESIAAATERKIVWLKRPGNTISNVTYLITSTLILKSTVLHPSFNTTNIFECSDTIFGGMVLVLAISSTLWHSCHVPFFHYVDLWSMDNSIVYLMIRHFVGFSFKFASWKSKTPLYQNPDAILVLLYAGIILATGHYYFFRLCWNHRYLHGHCGFSVHRRLNGTSNVWTKGHAPLTVLEVCLFACFPAILHGVPGLSLSFSTSIGSIRAGSLAQRTLVIGWSYRMLEKWALDGSLCPTAKPEESSTPFIQMVWNALVSPTAVLHWTTGITLLAGYVHARSIDE